VKTLTGRYRLIERLGAGGMSVVWRGYDEVLGRQVAVKLLAADFAAAADFRLRIRREAQAAARLSHPHITGVYDYGEAPDGTPYVVMELIEGESLAHRLAAGRLPWPLALRICAQVAEALAAAHDRGLVHRDVTPANVMLAASGVKVVDFGISALVGEHGGPVVGTPAYLAPEQLAGAPAQAATDVYALGLLLYQSLSGRLPWSSETSRRYRSTIPLPAIRGLPPEVAALVAECLNVDPTRRPASEAVGRRLAAIMARHAAIMIYQGTAGMVPAPRTAALPAVPARSGTRIMPAAPPPLPPPPPPPFLPRRRRWPRVFGAAVVIVLVFMCGAWYANLAKQGANPAAAASPPAPSPVVTHSPTPATGDCTVRYKVTADWKSGFSGEVTIANSGGSSISGWRLEFSFPGEQHVSFGWSGQWQQSDHTVTVRDLIYNGSIKPGKSTSLGFLASNKGGKNDKPDGFRVNGVNCHQNTD
jgi:serine/threonine-protein kinase